MRFYWLFNNVTLIVIIIIIIKYIYIAQIRRKKMPQMH